MTAGDIVTQNDGRGSFYLHAADDVLTNRVTALPDPPGAGVRDAADPADAGERKQS